MSKITVEEIMKKLNPAIDCKKFILQVRNNKIVSNQKTAIKYIDKLNKEDILINKENIDILNKILLGDDNNDDLIINQILYLNFHSDTEIYLYSLQGFSETFIKTYKNLYNYSFLKFILDEVFNNTINENVEDYLTSKTRDYVEHLVNTCFNCKECSRSSLFDEINHISTLTYEGLNVYSKLLIMSEENYDKYIDFYIRLENTISFDEHRKIRKLLEISDKNTYLIGTHREIFGLGKLKNLTNFNNEIPIFIFDFIGNFEYKINTISTSSNRLLMDKSKNEELVKWNLNENTIVNIKYGKPDLREIVYSERELETSLENVFKNYFIINPEEKIRKINTIKKIVYYAKNQKQGTTVVITTPDAAKSEVNKLKNQSIKIISKDLNIEDTLLENLIGRITNIDGAVYLDIDGYCHAIGVILDGVADENHGDSARGARYNSAVKYINKEDLHKECLIVVVSEDGMIDIIYNEKLDYLHNENKINKLLNEAMTFYNGNDNYNALNKLNNIISLDPKNYKAYNIKALIEFKLGNMDEALKCFNKAIELHPDLDTQ